MADEPTQPASVPVIIALAYTDTGQQDHTRIGRVEYHLRSDARQMVHTGQARWLTDPRNADDRWPINDDPAGDESAGDTTEGVPVRPLNTMSKSELRTESAAAAAMGPEATRLQLLAAAQNERRHPAEQPTPDAATAEPQPTDTQ